MARELEIQQLVQLLNTSPPGSPSYWMLIKSLYELSSISNREEMMPIIEAQLQQSLQPPEPPVDQVALEKARTEQFKAGSDAVFKKTAGILNLAKAEQIEDDNILVCVSVITQLAKDEQQLAMEQEQQRQQMQQQQMQQGQQQQAVATGQLPEQ